MMALPGPGQPPQQVPKPQPPQGPRANVVQGGAGFAG
jgi:hypothetical protein